MVQEPTRGQEFLERWAPTDSHVSLPEAEPMCTWDYDVLIRDVPFALESIRLEDFFDTNRIVGPRRMSTYFRGSRIADFCIHYDNSPSLEMHILHVLAFLRRGAREYSYLFFVRDKNGDLLALRVEWQSGKTSEALLWPEDGWLFKEPLRTSAAN